MSGLKQTIARSLDHHLPRIWMERELRTRPHHFEPELQLVPALCDKQHLAIDIGANTGVYSYYMSKFCRQVVAFEPNRDLWPRLRRLLDNRSLRLEPFALSGASGTATFRVDHTNTGVATIEEKNDLSCVKDPKAIETRTVEIRTLDSFGLKEVSLIKIDTEGHEESVLAGAHQTLQDSRPALIIESEDRHNPGAPRRVVQFLDELGYGAFFLKGFRLNRFENLGQEELEVTRLAEGDYVNNFIFLPLERPEPRERLEALLANQGR